MTAYRRQQFIYILTDAVSSLIVWLSFLIFRWLVYNGRVLGMQQVLIPAFSFVTPLILYPIACLVIYYLSGFYMHPLRRKFTRDVLSTFISSVIISLLAFFVVIIDDHVADYRDYIASLAVLFIMQFVISLTIRLIVIYISRTYLKVNNEIIIDLPEDASEQELFNSIKAAYPTGKDILVRPRIKDILTGAARIVDLNGEAFIRITDLKMSDSQLCQKRAFDVVSSAMLLILLSPLLLVIALLVKFSSPGSVIYRQERIGLHGLPFMVLKFRTMYENAEQDGVPHLTDNDDPRITPVGRWLRKYRIDELPQLWNVLKGDMSIVGPRPERAYFIRIIEQQAPYYCLIYKIRPGLTSWGPIKVGYTDTIGKMILRLQYDIAYMENMSPLLDAKILFYTAGVLIGGKGK